MRKIYEYTGTLGIVPGLSTTTPSLGRRRGPGGKHGRSGAARYLAIGRIGGDAGRMAEFNKEQQDKLRKAKDAAELDVIDSPFHQSRP